MAYEITKKEEIDKAYHGYDILYQLNLTFQKQSCTVQAQLYLDTPNQLRIYSSTDGYHWLSFFLAQDPQCTQLVELEGREEKIIVNALFSNYGISYTPEDKESCFLTFEREVTDADVATVARIIHDRFTVRERFFE